MRGPQAPPKLLDQLLWPVELGLAYVQFALSMYVQAMCAARPQDDAYLRPYKIARDATWLLLLVLGFLQYYFMDVYAQIAALPVLDVRN